MAKTVRDSKLENRTLRVKLKTQREPHWKSIGQGVHIGYYKGTTTASWQVRYRNSHKKYIYETLGLADDVMDSDGQKILSFYEAQEIARKWVEKQIKAEQGAESYQKNRTVSDVMDNYMEWFKHERKSYKETQNTINAHIKPLLGNIPLSKLTSERINKWKNDLASIAPRKRSIAGEEQKYSDYNETDPDTQRRRKATVNRILTVLKAALNRAFQEGFIESDNQWKRIKPFRSVDKPIIRFLKPEECIRIINASEPTFRLLVKAALLSGCRYSEITNLVCDDFDPISKTLLIRISKSNKPRRISLNDEGVRFFNNQTSGKHREQNIFLRKDGEKWNKSHQSRLMIEASKNAQINPVISFHILRHTYASQLVMRGVSLSVIASQLGHSDTRTCERHYAHLCPSHISDVIQANMPKFGFIEESNVKKFRNE